jgi:uncharacterized RDD family membrane protein YckC
MPAEKKYTGFGTRLVAFIIDTTISKIIITLVSFGLLYTSLTLFRTFILIFSFSILFDAAYEIFLTSRYGGTVGKILVKCRVTDENGNNISIWRSIGRYFAKIISWLALGIGVLMILWDPKRQGLHDKIAGTYVVADDKSRIKDSAKKAVVICTVAVSIGYIIYVVTMFIFGVIGGVKAGVNELDHTDLLNSIDRNCNSEIPIIRDACIYGYSDLEGTFKVQNDTTTRLKVCGKIKSGRLQADCLTDAAKEKLDVNLCSYAKMSYHKIGCEKQYAFYAAMLSFFKIDE